MKPKEKKLFDVINEYDFYKRIEEKQNRFFGN